MMAFCWAWKIWWNGHYLCCEEIFSFICKQQLSLLLLLTFIYYPLIFIEYYLYLRNKNKLFKYISSFNPLNSVYYYSHFTENKIEAVRSQIYCQGSQSWMAMILIIDLLALKPMFLTLRYIVFLNKVFRAMGLLLCPGCSVGTKEVTNCSQRVGETWEETVYSGWSWKLSPSQPKGKGSQSREVWALHNIF